MSKIDLEIKHLESEIHNLEHVAYHIPSKFEVAVREKKKLEEAVRQLRLAKYGAN